MLYFGKDIASLADLPQMTNAKALILMDLLLSITPAALFSNPVLAVLLALERDRLSVKYGNSPASGPSFASYGSTLCGVTQDIGNGYRFGMVALKLLERFDAPAYRGRTIYIVNATVAHWKEPLARTLRPLREAFQYALDNGDMFVAALSLMVHHMHAFWMGRDLRKLEKELLSTRKRVKSLQQQIVVNYLERNLETVRILNRQVSQAHRLKDNLDRFSNQPDPDDPVAFCAGQTYALYLNFLFGQYEQANKHADRAIASMTGVSDMYFAPIIVFYHLLNRMQLLSTQSLKMRKSGLKKLARYFAMLKNWAEHAPSNHRHKYLLCMAERYRLLENHHLARDGYEKAMEQANRNGFPNEEALILEMAGQYLKSQKKLVLGKFYLEKAYRAYLQWGADCKAQMLEEQHPECFEKVSLELRQVLSSSVSLGFSTKSTTTTTLDLHSIFKACQAISGEINLDRLCETLMRILLENAGAQKGALLLMRDQHLRMMAMAQVNQEAKGVEVTRIPMDDSNNRDNWHLPTSIVNYVQRTRQAVVLTDAAHEAKFTEDLYIKHEKPKSVVTIPLIHQNELAGILYLENKLTSGAFTPDRLEILALLSGQASIALQNSDLYTHLEMVNQTLEERVSERTQELELKNQELKSINEEIVKTQNQMLMQEKMASMGTLTAGIAHEIRNPLNFVNNFADSTKDLTEELIEELDQYMENPTRTGGEELRELLQDLAKNAGIIHNHGQRATQIVNSMMSLARGDRTEKERADLNRIVEEFATLAYHGRKNHHSGSRAVLDKKLNPNLPRIPLVAQNMSRVIINIVNNAMDALMEKQEKVQGEDYQPRLSISLEDLGQDVCIRFRDNGKGIPADKREEIFTPFFTTKPTGTGNIGLGLALSYDIVVQQHGGKLELESEENQFTEFRIVLPKTDRQLDATDKVERVHVN
jgi:signal transduction histidine kinase